MFVSCIVFTCVLYLCVPFICHISMWDAIDVDRFFSCTGYWSPNAWWYGGREQKKCFYYADSASEEMHRHADIPGRWARSFPAPQWQVALTSSKLRECETSARTLSTGGATTRAGTWQHLCGDDISGSTRALPGSNVNYCNGSDYFVACTFEVTSRGSCSQAEESGPVTWYPSIIQRKDWLFICYYILHITDEQP